MHVETNVFLIALAPPVSPSSLPLALLLCFYTFTTSNLLKLQPRVKDEQCQITDKCK